MILQMISGRSKRLPTENPQSSILNSQSSIFPRCAQQSAGGEDVLAAGCPDGGEDAMRREVVAQPFHLLLIGSVEVTVGNLVETDEVDAALQSSQQAHGFTGMALGVVESAKDNIFKRQPPLVGEIILSEQVCHLTDGISALGGHELGALFGDGCVQTDGDMALALI